MGQCVRDRDAKTRWTVSETFCFIANMGRNVSGDTIYLPDPLLRICAARHGTQLLSIDRTYGQHKVRPGIKALGTHSEADFFDVTFVNPLASSYIGQLRQRPLAALNKASSQRFARFQEFLSSTNNCKLVPIPILALIVDGVLTLTSM